MRALAMKCSDSRYVYLQTEIESAGGETSHRSHHMSGDYTGFLKIGKYI